MNDWRNSKNSYEIPSMNYSDQPYIIKNNENVILCSMTTGSGDEGVNGQKVITQRSLDLGKTWQDLRLLEENDAPENSYSVLLKTKFGRVYCFYNFNKDNLRKLKADNPPYTDGFCYRVDSQGYYVFRYSDDFGLTWSKKRYEVPIKNFLIDLENPYNGEIQFFWNVGKPLIDNDDAYLSIHKVGGFGINFFTRSEGVLIKASNIMIEKNVESIQFETLPKGDIGIKTPIGGGPIAEEQSYVKLNDGSYFTVFRTTDGKSAYSYSRDKGKSWEPSKYMPIKHPRAANFVWKLSNDKYLYWFHNHGGKGYLGRNPAWCLLGEEINGYINWSQPEILIYDDDPQIRMSYPDFIEIDNKYFITMTNKDKASIIEIDNTFIKTICNFSKMNKKITSNLIFEATNKKCEFPIIPKMSMMNVNEINRKSKDLKQGFTIELLLNGITLDEELVNTIDESGQGMKIIRKNKQIEFTMSDGMYTNLHICNEKVQDIGNNHIAIIVDGGPKIISSILNGKFNDGKVRQYGFSRFSPYFTNCNGKTFINLGKSVKKMRIYDRALLTCEVVGNFNFECYN
ncbi:MAG: exo-alpha-sialidase [Clostridiales bacterium]|nr:exo-alpha-sialidase [Clostridiales bacterium]